FIAIISAGAGFITGFNWGTTGSKLMNAIGEGLKKIDAAKLGETLSKLLHGVIQAGKDILTNTDWSDIAHTVFDKILTFLENIDWAQLQADLGELLVSLFMAAFDILAGALVGIGEHAVTWAQTLYDAMCENGEFTIQGFFDGASKILEEINPFTFIWKHLVSPIIDAVKEKLKIGSPSKVFEELGEDTIVGYRNGVEDNWSSITGFFPKAITELTSKVKRDWEGLRQTIASVNFSNVGRNAMTTLKTGITTAWGTVKSTASSLWSGLNTDLGKTDFSETGTKMTSSLKSGINRAWGDLQTAAVNLWGGLRDTFTNTDFTRVGAGFVNGIKSGISSGWSTVSKTALSLWSGLADDLKNDTDMSGVAGDLISGLANGLNDGWENITNTIWNKCGDMLDTFKSFFKIGSPSRVFFEQGEFLTQGLNNGIQYGSAAVTETMTTLSRSINDCLTIDSDDAQESVRAYASGISDSMQTARASVLQTAAAITDGIDINANVDSADTLRSVAELSEGIADSMEAAQNSAQTAVAGITDAITGGMTIDSATALRTVSEFTDGITGKLTEAGEKVTQTMASAAKLKTNIDVNASVQLDDAEAEQKLADLSTAERTARVAVVLDSSEAERAAEETRIPEMTTSLHIDSMEAEQELARLRAPELTTTIDTRVAVSADEDAAARALAGIRVPELTIPLHIDGAAVQNGIAELIGRVKVWLEANAPTVEIAARTLTAGLDAVAEKLTSIAETFRAIAGNALRAAGALAESASTRKPQVIAETDRTRTAAAPQASGAFIGLDALTDRLARLTSAINSIAEALPRFEQIGIPQVAAGTVIPAKVRIADIPAAPAQKAPSNKETNALLGKIIELLESQDTGARSETIQLTLDGRKLAEVMRRYNAQTGRITNGGSMR
ncbi:MAG: hypothetical protein J6Y26_00225, partial [Lachnospiraceae bacterium]|nr:hypothetical protein [Lachnospiraceae bacterium]